MSKYRTAMGKVVDMSQIASKNEHVRAVGNMPVNARGDTIDSQGKVILPVTRKVGKTYQKTVSNRAANVTNPNVARPSEPVANKQVPVIDDYQLTPDEQEFQDTSAEDDEIEKIKAKTNKKTR